MALTIEKKIDLTAYENNPAPKVVDQLAIIHEANDGEIVQYYLSSHKQGDKNSHAIGIPVEDSNGLKYRYDDYDQITWGAPGHRIIQTKRLDRLGVKAFPNIGAIAFYRLAYRNISRIVAPVNRKQTRTTAPALTGIKNLDNSTVTFTITPPTGDDAPKYKCYRIVMQNGDFGESHITYETTFTTPKPRISGNYECYAIGYETEGQFCSEDSNSLFFDLVGDDDSYESANKGNSSIMYGTDNPPKNASDGALYFKIRETSAVTLLDYVESDGTQYIDTEYIPKANTRVELTATVTNNDRPKYVSEVNAKLGYISSSNGKYTASSNAITPCTQAGGLYQVRGGTTHTISCTYDLKGSSGGNTYGLLASAILVFDNGKCIMDTGSTVFTTDKTVLVNKKNNSVECGSYQYIDNGDGTYTYMATFTMPSDTNLQNMYSFAINFYGRRLANPSTGAVNLSTFMTSDEIQNAKKQFCQSFTVVGNEPVYQQCLFGSDSYDPNARDFAYSVNSHGKYEHDTPAYLRAKSWTNGSTAYPFGVKATLIADESAATVTDETGRSQTISAGSGTLKDSDTKMFIFDMGHKPTLNTTKPSYCDGERVIAKLYRFRIYEGNSLVRDLCPALDADNVPCLYDTVGKAFYRSAVGTLASGGTPETKKGYAIVSKHVRIDGNWIETGYTQQDIDGMNKALNQSIDDKYKTLDTKIEDTYKASNQNTDDKCSALDLKIDNKYSELDSKIGDSKITIDTELKDSKNPVANATIYATLNNVETLMSEIIGGDLEALMSEIIGGDT